MPDTTVLARTRRPGITATTKDRVVAADSLSDRVPGVKSSSEHLFAMIGAGAEKHDRSDIMLGCDTYGGCLDTETVALGRLVAWVPRSCHGSDLRPHRDVRIEAG